MYTPVYSAMKMFTASTHGTISELLAKIEVVVDTDVNGQNRIQKLLWSLSGTHVDFFQLQHYCLLTIVLVTHYVHIMDKTNCLIHFCCLSAGSSVPPLCIVILVLFWSYFLFKIICVSNLGTVPLAWTIQQPLT